MAQEISQSLVRDVPPLKERVKLFHQAIRELVPDCKERTNVPNCLFETDWAEDDPVHDQEFVRQIIQSFKTSQHHAWKQMLASCSEKQADILCRFADGARVEDIHDDFDFRSSTRASRLEFQHLQNAKTVPLHQLLSEEVVEHPPYFCGIPAKIKEIANRFRQTEVGIYEDLERKKPLLAYIDTPFSNWARTVENEPQYTFVPTTKYGVQQIVKFAKANDLGVRVSGYRHSWSPAFAQEQKCILISTLDLHRAAAEVNTESLAAVSTDLFSEASTELNMITPLGPLKEDPSRSLVRVGCATTNEQFREWCIKNKSLTLPLNVIMVEITFGGSNGPICHGAGIKHQTLSDLVHSIEYVDAQGEVRSITPADGDFLSAASGCFGLIGVITHLTLKLDKMSFAEMTPLKLDVIDAIPPPADMLDRIPPSLRKQRTEKQIQDAQDEFEKRASTAYYAEWFWFPYADQAWVNTWNTTHDGTGVVDFPSKLKIVVQWLEAVALEILQNVAEDTGTEEILPLLRASVTSRLAMASLPAGETIKAWLPDALHFRRAIQNTRVRDLELEIPLPPRSSDALKPDFSIVQRAWWEAIIKCYEHSDTCPMRMPLEMRIMGDSNVVMAPQRGNKLGTCSIEILTLHDCADIWPAFAQEVLDKWMELRTWRGQKLNIRPHWAKEWYDFNVDGKPFLTYLKYECYKDEIAEFNRILESIGKKHGWTRQNIQQRFSNEWFDAMFFDDMAAVKPVR